MLNKIYKSKRTLVRQNFIKLSKYFDRSLEFKMPESLSHNDLSVSNDTTLIILLDGTLNHSNDIHSLLCNIKTSLNRSSRIQAVLYSPYLKLMYKAMALLKLRKDPLPITFLTQSDLNDLCKLSGYTIVSRDTMIFIPFDILGICRLINCILGLIPFINKLALIQTVTLKPIFPCEEKPGLSVIVPARNEAGNIEKALTELSKMDIPDLEVIFIEGNSTDNTWNVIKSSAEKYSRFLNISYFQQNGQGKNDAVRLGFQKASKDLLTILDADLTVAPKNIQNFYDSYLTGYADFINGSRLLYPMEDKAMRFLNLLGNVFFAKALSFVLQAKLTDSLCGTKMFSKKDYERFLQWRDDFGDFDPFGDFELLFPAAYLKLGIINVPINYKARTYGSTNIRRFRDGLILFKMTLLGLFKITLRS